MINRYTRVYIAMPISINGQSYYRTAEVCRIVSVSRNTLFRWIKKGVLGQNQYRDWRGWRLFTPEQLDTLRTRTQKITAHNDEN